MKVFITGASGFIGRRLLRELLRHGDQVVALTRKASNLREVSDNIARDDSSRLTVLEGDPAQPGSWQQQIAGTDAVIALAGEPVMGARWTEALKRRLLSSRVESMRRMVEALASCTPEKRPRALLSASAVGYYGYSGHSDEELDENAAPGTDFLAQLCVNWEAATEAAAQSVRVVRLRIGVVLGEGGGALEKMIPAFRAFLGGTLGSGEQYIPWIHLEDVIGLIMLALARQDISGPLNLTAPQPVTMRELTRTLGSVLRRPTLLPIPATLLKLALGEAAQALLGSQRVIPRRAIEVGYHFRHPELLEALQASVV